LSPLFALDELFPLLADRHQHLADFDDVFFPDVDLEDRSPVGRGHFDHGLVGLDLG
jgi:hypothetical protein